MTNKDNVLNTASRGISNCIFNVYGRVGYFTDIENNNFSVDIYDSPSKVINAMSDEDAQKHLLKSIEVPFAHLLHDNSAEYKIIDTIVTTVESIVYKS
jgi:uncharacterized membrane protein